GGPLYHRPAEGFRAVLVPAHAGCASPTVSECANHRGRARQPGEPRAWWGSRLHEYSLGPHRGQRPDGFCPYPVCVCESGTRLPPIEPGAAEIPGCRDGTPYGSG